MGRIALRAADTVTYQETARLAIKINDSTTIEERHESPGSLNRLAWLTGLVGSLTIEEAFDSLAISTIAYRMYEANTVQARVYGEKKRLTPSEIVHNKIPDLVGGSYYVSSPDSNKGDLAPYTKKGAVPEGVLPVRDRVNYIVWLPSRCHSDAKPRLIDMPNRYSGRACAILSSTMRRIKQLFPDLEITILSSTYGTVGKLGPLTPADEADTLAKLFLGFHKMPARLVVEETPVYNVPDPDRRRIDLPTSYAEALGIRRLGAEWEYAFTDKEGIEVKVFVPFDSDLFYRWLDILNKRVSK